MRRISEQLRADALTAGAAAQAQCRMAIVDGYDPARHCAKVRVMPENALSGWLPILAVWSGNGWGLFAPVTPGEQVMVYFQEGSKEAGFIAGRLFSTSDAPLPVPSGEFWLVHQSGSFLKLHNDGSVQLNTAGNLNATVGGKLVASASEFDLTGNLVVSGNITASGAISDAKSSMQAMRGTYDGHTHTANGAAPPTAQM